MNFLCLILIKGKEKAEDSIIMIKIEIKKEIGIDFRKDVWKIKIIKTRKKITMIKHKKNVIKKIRVVQNLQKKSKGGIDLKVERIEKDKNLLHKKV